MSAFPPVMLDACCILNLAASGQFDRILKVENWTFVVGERAANEAQWIRQEGSDERLQVDLGSLIESGLLKPKRLESDDELALFIQLSSNRLMNDGEAEAVSIAVNRGCAVATDDRKARRIIVDWLPDVMLLSTASMLHQWQQHGGIGDTEMGATLRRIEYCASFIPRRIDPHYDWWTQLSLR